MTGFITDRSRDNVLRRNALALKGKAGMSTAELAEWLGDPMETSGANLFPPGPNYSSSVNMRYRGDLITATSVWDGVYIYGISIIGEASKFEGKTFTLSVDSMSTIGGGTPQISLYWHDNNGYEYAGANLTEAGSVTFTMFPNTNNRAYLAAYVYVTTDATITAGAIAKYRGVMLERGSTRHNYAPYSEVIATDATKGAYNYSDLNRVERAVMEIAADLGWTLETKTDWTMWDVPRVSDMERYIDNVRRIRNAMGSNIALPETGDRFTYGDANNIELILSNASDSIENAPRCGELLCGDM